jgi:hypothetical protein
VQHAIRPIIGLCSVLAVVAVGVAPAVALKHTEATVRARLADVKVKPSPNRPGWLVIGTWRESEIQLHEAGFQLVMVNDEKWPATRIAEVLAAEICGQVGQGIMQGFVDRLYRSRSLVREIDLGGNAGSSFKKRLTESLGTCRVELLAEGARWHTLTVTVRR